MQPVYHILVRPNQYMKLWSVDSPPVSPLGIWSREGAKLTEQTILGGANKYYMEGVQSVRLT